MPRCQAAGEIRLACEINWAAKLSHHEMDLPEEAIDQQQGAGDWLWSED